MARIINRGRGPEIEGTRITVYDIVDYQRLGWEAPRTAEWLKLTVEQVMKAEEYIAEHEEEVMANYRKIIERNAKGNPPELQAKIDARRPALLAKMDEIRRRYQETREKHREGNLG